MFPLFATGVSDTGGKFAAGVVDTGGKLPPVSLTMAQKFVLVLLTAVANLPPVSTTLAAFVSNLSPVSLIQWCTLTCKYLRKILDKI